MTVYEMRTFIHKYLSTICSDSLGSIQAAVKKLIGKECIECREYTENGIHKKEYSITDTGLIQFKEWINTPINYQKIKNMEEGKFFFLGMISKQTRIQSFKSYIESLEKEQEKLFRIKEFIENTKDYAIQANVERISKDEKLFNHLLEVSGEKTLERVVENIYKYQVYDLEYGLKRIQDDITFFKNILERELN